MLLRHRGLIDVVGALRDQSGLGLIGATRMRYGRVRCALRGTLGSMYELHRNFEAAYLLLALSDSLLGESPSRGLGAAPSPRRLRVS